MAKDDKVQEQQLSQEGEETQDPEGISSLLRRAANIAGQGLQRAEQEINNASRSTRQVVQRSSGTIADVTPVAADATKQALQRSSEVVADATTDAASVARRGAIRTGEVLSGADIRRFDEFTEAVTRVAVGLHHDQTDIKERVSRLEQEAADIRRFQSELSERLETIERIFAAQQDEDTRG